jgi:multicomponent K+:H+ antiporter subunit E
MKRWVPFPLLWAVLLAMWLALYQTTAPGHIMLGATVAFIAVRSLRALQEPQARVRRPGAALALLRDVVVDIVRSNIAVAWIVLNPRAHGRRAGFVNIPLDMRNPVGLAVLACIITSTPGSTWAGYNSASGVLTLHILDLVDEDTWVRTIKGRYERRLMEVFE